MPNVVDSLRNRILAEYPTATVAERGRSHIKFRLPDAPDGGKRFALDTSIGSLHYEDGGQWVECNTDWVNSDLSGFTDKADRCRFKAHAKSDGTRRIYPRRDVTTEYIEFGTLGAFVLNKWRDFSLPARLRDLSTLSWDGNQAAVKMVTTPDSLKLTITLKTSSAPKRFRWQVTLAGLTLDESWQLVSATDGTVVATLPQPTMTDSSAEPITRDVTATYASGYIDYQADVTGLTYPIEIDPTVDVSVDSEAETTYLYSWNPWGTGGAFANNLNYVRAGKTTDKRAFTAKFDGITIPSGATIDAAYMTLTAYENASGTTCKLIIYGDDDGTPSAPTDTNTFWALAETSASVNWEPGAWTSGSAYNSADISSIISELLASYTYSSASMQFMCGDNGSSTNAVRSPQTYNGGTPPSLHIEYTEGGTTHTIAATVNAASTTTAGAASKLVMAGTVTATATATAAAQKSAFASATIEGANTTTATAQANRYPAATIAGASSVTVAGVRTASLAATIESAAVVTSALTVEGTGETHEIGATITAASTITTSASKHLTATVTINATSSVAGMAQKAAYPAARVDGQSTAIVAAQKTAYPAADITPTSTTTAGVQRTALIGGNVTTSSTVTADAVRIATLAAILTTALSTSGTLTLAYAAAASIAAASVLSASLAVSELTTTELGTSMTAGSQMNPYRSLMTAGAQMRRVR